MTAGDRELFALHPQIVAEHGRAGHQIGGPAGWLAAVVEEGAAQVTGELAHTKRLLAQPPSRFGADDEFVHGPQPASGRFSPSTMCSISRVMSP